MKSRIASFLGLVSLLVLTSGQHALACAACYGDTSGSKQTTAAAWGIFAMVVIMFGMLGAVIAFVFYLRWRAQNPLPDYSELLGETDTSPKPETTS